MIYKQFIFAVNLYQDPYLWAGRTEYSCVKVVWRKKQAGACTVCYEVKFITDKGLALYKESGVDIGVLTKCKIRASTKITIVELTMRHKTVTSIFRRKVPQEIMGNVLLEK